MIINEFQNTIEFLFWQVSWGEVALFGLFVVLVYIMDQQLKFKKPRKLFVKFNGLILQRTLSVLCYYYPYLESIHLLLEFVSVRYPYVCRLFLPDFVSASLNIFQICPFAQAIYIFIGYGVFIRYRIPKDRFIRYNLMYSIVLVTMQSILNEIFIIYVESNCPEDMDKGEPCLIFLIFWLYIYIPCFIRALLGKYTSNSFMRETIEVHLGRDGPDFVWWDRRKKKK